MGEGERLRADGPNEQNTMGSLEEIGLGIGLVGFGWVGVRANTRTGQ